MSSRHEAELQEMEEELQRPEEVPALIGGQLSWVYEEPQKLCFCTYSSPSSSGSSSPCVEFPESLLRLATGRHDDPQSPPRDEAPGNPPEEEEEEEEEEVEVEEEVEEEEVEEEAAAASSSSHGEKDGAWGGEEEEGGSREEAGAGAGLEAQGPLAPLGEDELQEKTVDLVAFLLHKYRMREAPSETEMLRAVLPNQEEHLPLVLSQAHECLQLVFGIDLYKLSPEAHCYVLVPALGLTYDGMTEDEDSRPKTGLLVMVLGVIALENDCASEKDMWNALGTMGVYDGREHYVYGEPRNLLTRVWVQEQYLVYQQVCGSWPPSYVFLWGPRAYTETSREDVLEFLLRADWKNPSYLMPLSRSNREGGPEAGTQPPGGHSSKHGFIFL